MKDVYGYPAYIPVLSSLPKVMQRNGLASFFGQVGIRMIKFTTKIVKVPVRILEEDEELRILKYRALDEEVCACHTG